MRKCVLGGGLCIIYAMTFVRCRAMRFVCIFIIPGRAGLLVTQFRRVTNGAKKKKSHIPSKRISIFIALPAQSQKEGFYWDEVSTSLEVILPSSTCLLMDGSIASARLLRFDCDFKDFPFSLPLKPGGIIQPFAKDEVLHAYKLLAQRKRVRGMRGQELCSVIE